MDTIVESIFTTLQGLRELDPQTLSNLIAAASLLATLVFGVLSAVALFHQLLQGIRVWRSRRILEREFGSDFYLPETIERSTRYYVRPDCSSIDPSDEADLRSLVLSREDLFSVVDRFLEHESAHRHLLLLADSGMGKSSFVLNYYASNRLRWRRQRLLRLAVVPLGHPNANSYIAAIQAKRETVLLLDAFDEDPSAITDYRARLEELTALSMAFRRTILTCRTQFFPRAVEIPTRAGFVYEPRELGQSGEYEFRKLYLMPFTNAQVTAYLRRRFRWRLFLRRRARALVNKVPDLSVRPMLLAHIPDLVRANTIPASTYELYEILVSQWVKREEGWIDPKTLDEFSERLAINLHENRKNRGAEWILRDEIPVLARSWGMTLPTTDEWKLTGRSLLNRDSEGRYKFAHRSILEYFLARSIVQGTSNLQTLEPTDQVRTFIRDSIEMSISNSELPDIWHIAYLFGDAILNNRDPSSLFSSRLGLLGSFRLDKDQRVFAATLLEMIAKRHMQECAASTILHILEGVVQNRVRVPDASTLTAKQIITWWIQLAGVSPELALADAIRRIFMERAIRLSMLRENELNIWDVGPGLMWSLHVSFARPASVDVWATRQSLIRGGDWREVVEQRKSATTFALREPTAYDLLSLWLCLKSNNTHFRRILGETGAQEVEMKIHASCDAVLHGEQPDSKVVANFGVASSSSILEWVNETWPELMDSAWDLPKDRFC